MVNMFIVEFSMISHIFKSGHGAFLDIHTKKIDSLRFRNILVLLPQEYPLDSMDFDASTFQTKPNVDGS